MKISLNQPHQPSTVPDIARTERSTAAVKNQKVAAPVADTITLSDGFRTGRDNIHSLGVLALGGEDQLQSWSWKGLEISDDTIEKAYNAWNQGFKEAMGNQGKPSLVLNRYDIVASSQRVPEWFLQERGIYLDAITDTSLKASFESGAFYHVTGATAGPYARLLSLYNEISES